MALQVMHGLRWLHFVSIVACKQEETLLIYLLWLSGRECGCSCDLLSCSKSDRTHKEDGWIARPQRQTNRILRLRTPRARADQYRYNRTLLRTSRIFLAS